MMTTSEAINEIKYFSNHCSMTSEIALFLEVTRLRPSVRFSDKSRRYMKINMVNGWNDTSREKSK